MRDFPSCSNENGVQISNSSSSSNAKNAQNLVICIYRCRIRGKTCLITVTWTKNLIGQCVTIKVNDSHNQTLCKVEIKPWLFTKRKGSRNLDSYSVFYDLSSAKYGSSPEPIGGYYLSLVVDKEMILLLGDMKKEAFRKSFASPCSSLGAMFIAKKEHVFGKRMFATKAQFSSDDKTHEIVIECEVSLNDPCLIVHVDGKILMEVKRIHWKFRGNDRIVVGGISVEVFWDVYSWFFGLPCEGNGVFMFRTCQSEERTWSLKSQSFGFSLILYAWKKEF